MIGRIRGKLIEKSPPMILVECCGVGYEVLTPMTSIYQLSDVGEEVILHTHFVVREDAQHLYGFATKSDRRLFQELIKINGIGAKMALAILSGMDSHTLVSCIENKDHSLLCTIPGIGKKTAERMIVDIKDKIDKLSLELFSLEQGFNTVNSGNLITPTETKVYSEDNIKVSEAVDALESLGYKRKDADRYVAKVKSQASSVEEIIKLALKQTHSKKI